MDRINRGKRSGSISDGVTRQQRSQSAVSSGSQGATPPRPPTGGAAAANRPPGVPAPRGGRRRSAGNVPAVNEAATSAVAAKASQAAAGARGWFRRMSKSAADTTKRLETKYKAEVKQAGNTMSGRMAEWGSKMKERSAELKKTIQRKLEEAEGGANGTAAAGAGAGVGAGGGANGADGGNTAAYAIAGDSDTDEDEEDMDPEAVAARRRDRQAAAQAQARALLHLELAGLATGADYDLEKWDGTARVRVAVWVSLPPGAGCCRGVCVRARGKRQTAVHASVPPCLRATRSCSRASRSAR